MARMAASAAVVAIYMALYPFLPCWAVPKKRGTVKGRAHTEKRHGSAERGSRRRSGGLAYMAPRWVSGRA